ncbi:hypothetical protein NKH77_06455 [Streptomyces sp. M19]
MPTAPGRAPPTGPDPLLRGGGRRGVAVGVHTTQFAIRDHGLLRAVLELASQEVRHAVGDRPFLRIAGSAGPYGRPYGRPASPANWTTTPSSSPRRAARGGPGRAPGPQRRRRRGAARGRLLPPGGRRRTPPARSYWRRLADQESTVAVKAAPFDRYRTLELVEGVAASDRGDDVALYTGNDDAIVADLLTRTTCPGPRARSCATSSAGSSGTGRCGPAPRCGCSPTSTPPAQATRPPGGAPWPGWPVTPTPTRRSTTCAAASPAVSPVSTKCCAARACWPGPGAWTPRRASPRPGRGDRPRAHHPPLAPRGGRVRRRRAAPLAAVIPARRKNPPERAEKDEKDERKKTTMKTKRKTLLLVGAATSVLATLTLTPQAMAERADGRPRPP